MVGKDRLAALMAGRRSRPLFVIDIAVPRDVEPAANDIEGVYLYDIDSLQAIARQAMESRRQELDACARIIHGHVREFGEWWSRECARLGVDGHFDLQESASSSLPPAWPPVYANAAEAVAFPPAGNDVLRS